MPRAARKRWIYSTCVPLFRLTVAREPEPPGYQRPVVTNAEQAFAIVRPLLEGAATEHMVVLPLSASHRVLGACICGIGSVDECQLSHADILRHVLVAGGRAFIVAHNHPSGDPEPSSSDIGYTQGLARAARAVDVRFLDHLVVGSGNRYSSIRLRRPDLFD